MADRPILFSTPMVEAIVAGRKTQTRRIPQPQPVPFMDGDKECEVALHYDEDDKRPRVRLGRVITTQRLRFGLGDRLWVREAWAKTSVAPIIESFDNPFTVYRAADNRSDYGGPWKPGIHMARYRSRITLLVTDIRLQRLQDMCAADSVAEGIECDTCVAMRTSACQQMGCFASIKAFEKLWDSINGARFPWSRNPWVVALTFKTILANIDSVKAQAVEPQPPLHGSAA